MTSDKTEQINTEDKVMVIVVGPSGVGKANLIEELEKRGPFAGLPSEIEYTGPTILHIVENGVESYTIKGRMPRREEEGVSIWRVGITDIYAFDLGDPGQRKLAQANIDSGVYSLENIDFNKVSKADKKMYRFLNKADYEEEIRVAIARRQQVTDDVIFDARRSYKVPLKGRIVLECVPGMVELFYDLAQKAGYRVKVFFIRAPEDLLLGQMTEFRGEPANVVTDRMSATRKMYADSSNPETPLGRGFVRIKRDRNLEVIVTTRKTFYGGKGDSNNGRPYNFKRTSGDKLELQFLDGVKDPTSDGPEPRLGDPDGDHIRHILSVVAGERPQRDLGELEERILNIIERQNEIIQIKLVCIKYWKVAFFQRQAEGQENDYVEARQNELTWLFIWAELHLKELKKARESDLTTETKIKTRIH